MDQYLDQNVCQMCACAQAVNKFEQSDHRNGDKNSTTSRFTFGGLQQFLNKYHTKTKHQLTARYTQGEMDFESAGEHQELEQVAIECHQQIKSSVNWFSILPDCVTLNIFAYLSAVDLCRISGVCKSWEKISYDEMLWKMKLKDDMFLWKEISYTTNPLLYMSHPGWSSRDVYLKSSPEHIKMQQEEFTDVSSFTKFIRHLVTRNVPKFAMFGPGLECETSGIVRRIFWDVTNTFKAVGLVPGNFGVGSGMTIKFKNDRNFNLLTLYSNTKRVRSNINNEERAAKSRLYSHEENKIEVHDCIKEVCRQVGGFVYVINADELQKEKLELARAELHAMVDRRWSTPEAPLLILSCTANSSIKSVPCIDIVRELGLGHFHRPWKVFNIDIESVEEIVLGFNWIMEQTIR